MFARQGKVFGKVGAYVIALKRLEWTKRSGLGSESGRTYPAAAGAEPKRQGVRAEQFTTGGGKGKLEPPGAGDIFRAKTTPMHDLR